MESPPPSSPPPPSSTITRRLRKTQVVTNQNSLITYSNQSEPSIHVFSESNLQIIFYLLQISTNQRLEFIYFTNHQPFTGFAGVAVVTELPRFNLKLAPTRPTTSFSRKPRKKVIDDDDEDEEEEIVSSEAFKLKLQQKFRSFKERHNNLFKKDRSQLFRQKINRHEEDTEEEDDDEEEEGGKRFGKRIDLIRKKLREHLAYSSRTLTETTTLVERTFIPKHLKSERIHPTTTQEMDLSTNTLSPIIDRDIFKPKFRKNMLDRLRDQEESSEEDDIFEPTITTVVDDEDDYEIVSSKVDYDRVSVVVPVPLTSPIPSTKEVKGIPRRYSYDEENRYNQFVNIETELEGGESQNVEVVNSNNNIINNDRIDVEELEYNNNKKQQQQNNVPLYNVFSNMDLTTLPFFKQTTPTIPTLEAGNSVN